MSEAKPAIRRCAIYTRKSSEEGLEQDFNSLHAQRESCEAFIRSHRGEGWRLVEAGYDDGGLSGATMERPGLQRLISDIRAGGIDVVVVYKIDRLTRSLADFAKIVEVFDTHRVSFVAVTQQFNTTTSMGRLTLNILLSFAQFEREVTGERIRDKIAASKRKGMWMGGRVPLGYDVIDRKLIVNPSEAEIVRMIFRLYRELGCVRKLKGALDAREIRSKLRHTPDGGSPGGKPFSRGALYAVLANRAYIGEIRHKDACHPGIHEAIIDRDVWHKVQQQLLANTPAQRAQLRKCAPSPLTGKLFDQSGERLTPSHAVKNDTRYRYYVSHSLLNGSARHGGGWRLPAREIEQSVAAAAQRLLRDRSALVEDLRNAGVTVNQLPALLKAIEAYGCHLCDNGDTAEIIATLVERVELKHDRMLLTLSLQRPLGVDAGVLADLRLTRTFPMELRRRGIETRLVIDDNGASKSRVDPALVKAIARGRRWFEDLITGRSLSIGDIAKREKVTDRFVSMLLPLASLSPRVIEGILEGTQPPDLTTEALIKRIDLPIEWVAQERLLRIFCT